MIFTTGTRGPRAAARTEDYNTAVPDPDVTPPPSATHQEKNWAGRSPVRPRRGR
jgi:hypothetical protein